MKKENWENRKISEQAKKTAKHIGIISEGAIQTLIDEICQEEKQSKEISDDFYYLTCPHCKKRFILSEKKWLEKEV